MIAVTIILSILAIIGIYGGILYINHYSNENNFDFMKFGMLTTIPFILVFISVIIAFFKDINYWKALEQKDLDILIFLALATIAFIWVIVLFLCQTNFVVTLLSMLVLPPFFLILFLILCGLASSPIGWLLLILWLRDNDSK